MQNPNGVMKYDQTLMTEQSLRDIKQYDVDLVVLPETNRNWQNRTIQRKWETVVRKVWKHAKILTTSTPVNYSEVDYLAGGVGVIVTNKWSSRVVEVGVDTMGRWIHITFQGQRGQFLTCVGVYRVNPGRNRSVDTNTAWRHQYNYILEKRLRVNTENTTQVQQFKKKLIRGKLLW